VYNVWIGATEPDAGGSWKVTVAASILPLRADDGCPGWPPSPIVNTQHGQVRVAGMRGRLGSNKLKASGVPSCTFHHSRYAGRRDVRKRLPRMPLVGAKSLVGAGIPEPDQLGCPGEPQTVIHTARCALRRFRKAADLRSFTSCEVRGPEHRRPDAPCVWHEHRASISRSTSDEHGVTRNMGGSFQSG